MFQNSLPVANKHFRTTNLSNTAQTVFAAAAAGDKGRTTVLGFRIYGGAAAEVVVFRAIADTPVFFRVPVGIAGYVESNLPFEVAAIDGLEVITESAAGDVEVEVYYFVSGNLGIGN